MGFRAYIFFLLIEITYGLKPFEFGSACDFGDIFPFKMLFFLLFKCFAAKFASHA
jgi:hypothetical protein